MKEILKVPLFILPNVVFFPSTSLPLYIAKQKYESLIQSAIQHGQFVGVSLQKDDSYFEGFQGHEIFGVGRPIIVERIPNGIQKILLKGFHRVRLLGINKTEPFYEATTEVLPDQAPKNPHECHNEAQKMRYVLQEWIDKTISSTKDRQQFSQTINDKYSVIDYICTFLIADEKVRQALLENTSLESRIEILKLILDLNYPFQENIQVCEAIKSFEYLERTTTRYN